MLTLFVIVFLDLIGFGMIIPVFPFYAERTGVDPASVIFFLGLYSLGQLVGAPLWGSLSDRMGRRPVLLLTLLGNTAASVLLAFADSGLTLALSRIAAGLAAGNVSTAYAYATDITTDATRPKALGLLGSAFGLGFIAGPALGGLLAGNDASGDGLVRVAWGAAGMSVLAFLLTLARLPESLSATLRETSRNRPRRGFGTYWARPGLREVLLTTIVVIGAVAIFQSTLALWAAERLAVGPRTLGWIYVFTGVVSVVVQVWMTAPLTRRFGAYVLARGGIVFVALGMAAVPLCGSIPPLLGALGVFGLGSALLNPTFGNLVAGLSDADERGAALGAYQSAASFGRVIGPFTASGIATLSTLSWPFAVGAVVSLAGILLVRQAQARAPHRSTNAPPA
jgi:DHA1 family tetracycline resistance protein-like MFS transporter